MSAKVNEAIETDNIETLEKKQELLKLSMEFQQRVAAIVGTTDTSVEVSITIPEDFKPELHCYLSEGKSSLYIKDDALPF